MWNLNYTSPAPHKKLQLQLIPKPFLHHKSACGSELQWEGDKTGGEWLGQWNAEHKNTVASGGVVCKASLFNSATWWNVAGLWISNSDCPIRCLQWSCSWELWVSSTVVKIRLLFLSTVKWYVWWAKTTLANMKNGKSKLPILVLLT